MSDSVPQASSRFRWAWRLLAYLSLGLGLIGIVVPGLPTVPFVLLAAFAAARGSGRLHRRLLAHPQSGPMIRDWQAQGAVSRRAKWLATGMMSAGAIVLFLTAPQTWMAATGTTVMAMVAAWLWRRPEPHGVASPPRYTARMNLKAIAVLFALTLPLIGCGNKGPLLLPRPVVPVESAPVVEPAPAAEATDVVDETAPVDTTTTTPVPQPDPATGTPGG